MILAIKVGILEMKRVKFEFGSEIVKVVKRDMKLQNMIMKQK